MKAKIYIYAGIILLIMSLAAWGTYTRQQLIKSRAENIRYRYNQQQLLDQVNAYKILTVTRDELIASMTREQDSLLHELKIKPKQVDRIVERWHYSVDTTGRTKLMASNDSLRFIIENNLGRDYPFLDKEGCFVFGGSVSVGDGLRLSVDRREYLNRSTEIAYVERENRFWFVRWGPWRAKIYVDNECGSDTVKELTVINNRRKR